MKLWHTVLVIGHCVMLDAENGVWFAQNQTTCNTSYIVEGGGCFKPDGTGNETCISHNYYRIQTAQIQDYNFNRQKSCAVGSGLWKEYCCFFGGFFFLPRAETINAKRDCESLKNLCHTIQNRWPAMFHGQCSTTYHSFSQHLVNTFWLEAVEARLVTECYYLFLHLKQSPHGQCCDNDEDVKNTVQLWLLISQAVLFYEDNIELLVTWYVNVLIMMVIM